MFTSNIDQYLRVIASNLKFTLGYSFSDYKNMVNNQDLRSINSQNINYGFELRSSFHGWFNYHFGSKWNYNEIKTSIRNSFTDNISFLDLALSFSKKIDLQIKAESYFFGSLDKENNKYNFLDFEARYIVVENKLSLSLSGKNLFNTETFRNYSLDDISISRIEYKLLPRFLLLAAEYRFWSIPGLTTHHRTARISHFVIELFNDKFGYHCNGMTHEYERDRNQE